MQQPRDVAAGGLTLGRASEIEEGRGRPATKQELAELAAFKERMAPVLPSKREASQIRRGMAIYRGMSPIEQLRWGDRTPAQLLAHATPCAPRRAATTSRARPRGRRATARAGARGDPDDDEPGGAGLQSLQRFRVIAPGRFRRDVDAWLGAGWVDLSEELVEHLERQAKIEDAAGGGPFASGGAA